MSIENSFLPPQLFSSDDEGGSSPAKEIPLSLRDRVNTQADFVLGELGVIGMAFNDRGFSIYRQEGEGDHRKILPKYDPDIMGFIRAYFATKLKGRINSEHQPQIPDLSLDNIIDSFDPEGDLFDKRIIGPQGKDMTILEVVKVINGRVDTFRKPH